MTAPEDPPPDGMAPEGKRELKAAFNELVTATAAKRLEREAPPPPKRRFTMAIVVMFTAVTALGAWALLRKPAEEPAASRATHVRADMVVLARRIVAFRAEHGRSPRALRELGAVPAGIAYRVINAEAWELRAPSGTDTIRLRSDQNPSQFLGDSVPR